MRFCVAILLLAGLAFSACHYDTGFGRIICTSLGETAISEPLLKVNGSDNKTISPDSNATRWRAAVVAYPERRTRIADMRVSIRIYTFPMKVVGVARPIYANATNNTNATNISSQPNSPPKSMSDCQAARERDWQVYCQIMWSSGFQLDCDNANEIAKNEILDRLILSKSSWQAMCLRGEW